MVIVRTIIAIGLMIATLPLLAEDTKRPSKAGSSLDDELLKQLDDTLEGKPAVKP